MDRQHQAVIIDGVRTPFMRSHKSFVDLSSYDLAKLALKGLLDKTNADPKWIDHVTLGRVIGDPNTSNVAREALLGAGLLETTPAHTVTLACISANIAGTSLADMIQAGRVQAGIFGGVDTCSDPPIRLAKNLRQTLVKLEKVKSPAGLLKEWKIFKALSFKDIIPDVPKVAEFSNGKTMGQGAEILCQQVGVSREETDAFAARSHALACKAQKEGIFKDHIAPVFLPPNFKPVDQDDGPREDATVDKLRSLKPVFDKNLGVCTAGNSSFLTDGASAVLMMSRKRAEELGYKPKAVLVDYIYQAGSPLTEMLSGPALTVPLLLARNHLKISDIDVWEIHEAFASQVVANLKLIASDAFAKKRLGLSKACGEIPMDKINTWGGSLSLGHPFGATGGRLIYTAAVRLQQSGAKYAVVTGCAAGGHGSAILLSNPEV